MSVGAYVGIAVACLVLIVAIILVYCYCKAGAGSHGIYNPKQQEQGQAVKPELPPIPPKERLI